MNELQAAQQYSHWMIGAIMGVGSGKSFASVGNFSADLLSKIY
jgi:hypothetical protein